MLKAGAAISDLAEHTVGRCSLSELQISNFIFYQTILLYGKPIIYTSMTASDLSFSWCRYPNCMEIHHYIPQKWVIMSYCEKGLTLIFTHTQTLYNFSFRAVHDEL